MPTDDCALTARYWDTVTRRVDLGPERGVMTAVIKDAIMRYKKYCRKRTRASKKRRSISIAKCITGKAI